MVRQIGKIFIRPSERAGFAGYLGTATIHVPGTGQVYSRGARRFVPDKVAIAREAARKKSIASVLEAERKRVAEEKARLELIEKERARVAEKARLEAIGKATAEARRRRQSTIESQRFLSQTAEKIRRVNEQ